MHMPKHVPMYHLQRRAQRQTPLVLTIVGIPISTFPACVNTIKAKVTIRTHSLPGAFIAAPWKFDSQRQRRAHEGQTGFVSLPWAKTEKQNRNACSDAEVQKLDLFERWTTGPLHVLLSPSGDAVTTLRHGGSVMWEWGIRCMKISNVCGKSGSRVLEFVVTWIPKLFCLTCE